MVVATQLGHHDATLVLKRYGRYAPNVSELLKGVAVDAPRTDPQGYASESREKCLSSCPGQKRRAVERIA
jgi:hypothetical protein